MQGEELQIFCPYHNYEIVFLDIQVGITLGERACCKDCIIKKPYNIKQAIQKINIQKLQETQVINAIIKMMTEELKQIEKTISQFKEEVESIFEQIFHSIEKQKTILQSQANVQNEIQINSLVDLQNLGQMIQIRQNNFECYFQLLTVSELENNKEYKQFNQLDINLNLNLHDQLNNIQKIVDQYMTTIKVTKIDSEQQVVFRNNYQVIQSYKMDKWIDPIVFGHENFKAVLCDCSGVIELNFENSKFINTRLISINNLTCIYFGTDLNWIITAGQDAIISIWQKDNYSNWKQCSYYKGHNQSINKIIINENKSQIISAGLDHKIVIWNRKEYKLEKLTSLKVHKKSVTSLAWSHSGEYFASGSADLNLIVWKLNNEQWELHQQICDQHKTLIYDIVFDDYDNMYSAAENINVWKQDNNKNYIFYLKIKTQNQVKKMFYNKTHQYLIILQKTIEIWKILQNNIVHKQSIDGDYYNCAISINGKFILAQKYQMQELELFELKQL